MDYVLGLDIGITSVGWALVDIKQEKIENLGVRIFDKAEHPKDGKSLAQPRRIARGMRRRVDRRSRRLKSIRYMLLQNILTTQNIEQVNKILCDNTINPYEQRAEGLERKLTDNQWIKALYHIAVRRGFKSNRKSDANDKEGGKMLKSITTNSLLMKEKAYQTVGQMLFKDSKFAFNKRNKQDSYEHTIDRSMLENEIKTLFSQQRLFGNEKAMQAFEEDFLLLFNRQKHYASGEQIKKMIGFCTFEKEQNNRENQPRAPKMAYSAEAFSVLQKAVNMKIAAFGSYDSFDIEKIQTILELCKKQAKVTYKKLRTHLKLDDNQVFCGLSYKNKDKKDPEEATAFEMKGYHEIRKNVEKNLGKTYWLNLSQNTYTLNAIAQALTYYKTDEDIEQYLQTQGLEKELIDSVTSLSFNKVIHLSLVALEKLLPHLHKGLKYNEACDAVGYVHYKPISKNKTKLLPAEWDNVKNPVVRRALSQTRKVVNAIIRQYGLPQSINIELARELNKPYEERQKIQKGQEEYRSNKEKAIEAFKQITAQNPNSSMLLKYRLWQEQDGYCMYSQEYIQPDKLAYDDTYTQVDHIIPYSRSCDDSMNNKVLVKSRYNQEKGNKTPYEYFGEDKWYKFEMWVISLKNLKNRKKQNLLNKNFNPEMKERHLVDTRYITKVMANYLRDHLQFTDESKKDHVLPVNGALTAFLRARWGLLKNRSESDKHHALDAAVIAVASRDFVKKLTSYSKKQELYNIKQDGQYIDPETGEIMQTAYREHSGYKEQFPQPWENFREELLAMLSDDPSSEIGKIKSTDNKYENLLKPLLVSRMPSRKGTGQMHKETIRSAKALTENMSISKISLDELDLKKLENMVGKERDYKLYMALKARLKEFDGKGEKAFEKAFYKPCANGQGPIVKKIKITEKVTSVVKVRDGLADNGSMARVDIYYKNKKYHTVPVYVSDIMQNKIKNKAINAKKPESEWTVIDNSFEFLFSLYKNDFIEVKNKTEIIKGYYNSCDISSGNIKIETHDNGCSFEGGVNYMRVGVKTAQEIKKYHIDLLGNCYEIAKESAPYELA